MIIEQAFFALPEFLVGTGFTRYDSEGTLVMAYSMALLQELNGRNVNNPIALISGQMHYQGLPNRRSDLYLDYDRIGVLSPELAAFGVRHRNWIEAKFFRKNPLGFRTGDKVNGSLLLLRDLIRLCAMPTHILPPCASNCGRYLLHAYEGRPSEHVAFKRNLGKGRGRADRLWMKVLHKSGRHAFEVGDLTGEPGAFDTQVGASLRSIKLKGRLTTLKIRQPGAKYCMFLNRIDEVDFEHKGFRVCVDKIGVATEHPVGSTADLRNAIDQELAP